jgi:hypothetical protein
MRIAGAAVDLTASGWQLHGRRLTADVYVVVAVLSDVKAKVATGWTGLQLCSLRRPAESITTDVIGKRTRDKTVLFDESH